MIYLMICRLIGQLQKSIFPKCDSTNRCPISHNLTFENNTFRAWHLPRRYKKLRVRSVIQRLLTQCFWKRKDISASDVPAVKMSLKASLSTSIVSQGLVYKKIQQLRTLVANRKSAWQWLPSASVIKTLLRLYCASVTRGFFELRRWELSTSVNNELFVEKQKVNHHFERIGNTVGIQDLEVLGYSIE